MSPNTNPTDDLDSYLQSFKQRAETPPPSQNDGSDLSAYLQSFKAPKPPATVKDGQGDESVARVVDDEASKLGWSDNARLSLLGDVGRENGWNRNIIFGGHSDPKNNAANLGLISWQGDRRANLINHLQQAGAVQNGQIIPDDNSLREMVRFLDGEIKQDYGKVHETVRNPNASTYDNSEALRSYIKYDPANGYNSYDPNFRVANNAKWANKAKSLGLGTGGDLTAYLNSFKGAPTDNESTAQMPPIESGDDLDAYLNSFKQPEQQTAPRLNPDVQTLSSGQQQQIQPPINQTVAATQTVKTPNIALLPLAPMIQAPREPTREEADPRLPQPIPPNASASSPVNRFGNQTVKQLRPKVAASVPGFGTTKITPEQAAAAEAEFNKNNPGLPAANLGQDNQATNAPEQAAQADNPISVQQGARNNLGSAAQVDLKGINLTGDALKEYVFRRGLEQIAPSYNLTPGEIDRFVEEGRTGGFFDDKAFQAGLADARQKYKDNTFHAVVPAWQIKQVLDARKENEQIANEQAARREVDAKTEANANSLSGQLTQGINQGLQAGYQAVTAPFNTLRSAVSGETPKIETPDEVAAKQQQQIYGNSSALDGRATQALADQADANRIRQSGAFGGVLLNPEYATNLVSSAAQVPADLFSSTVLTPAAIAQTAAERLAGRNTTVGDTFLGQASDAIKKSFGDNFKVHAGLQNDAGVVGVRKLGNLAGTLAIGMLPGGEVLTNAAFGGQTATSFYEDAKRYGAPEDVRLASAGIGAVLGTAQGSVFSKMFGGLSSEAKAGFIKEFADSMRAAVGKESANGLIKATTDAAEQSAPSAVSTIAKNSLEGAAATGGTTLAGNLAAQGLYDPNRKATEGVGASALEGAAIGGGLTALSHGGQAVNEISNSEPVKRAVEGIADVYKQTQIKPNLENLQDKLADIYDKADAANATVSADKIITELAPQLDKLPRKVKNEMIAAIQAGDAEAQASAKPVLGLPERTSTNETASPRQGAAVESPTTSESVPAPNADNSAGNVTPVTETSETLAKQAEAVASPESAKVAVLFTDPATAPPADSKSYRVRTEQGLIVANQEKVAAQFGIHDGKTFVDFVRGNPDAVSQLLGKPSDSYNPNNPAAITTDAQGNELSATNVSTPEEANNAFAKDRADYPNEAANHQIVSTGDVINARENGNNSTVERQRVRYTDKIRQRRDEATRQLNTDALTGLANKRGFEAARAEAEQNPSKHFISLDLNGFKGVNDELGHSEGDKQLVRAGEALRQAAKETGVESLLARPGGDEFAGIVTGTREQAEAVKARAEQIFGAKKIGKTTLSITGKVGSTFNAADSGLTALKTKRKIELARANGETTLSREGKPLTQTVQTERGTKAEVLPKVIDASDLITSLEPDYPQELQPRDRSRTASKAQISDIASKLNPAFLDDSPKASDGRPLVVPVQVKGHTRYAVISGNGRSAGIKEAYAAGSDKAASYADFARGKDASSTAKQPVYVGELDPNQVDLHSFAREANESATAQMSATEQAKTDAEKLSTSLMNSFVPADDGSIHAAANRDFVRGFLGQVVGKTDIGRLTMPDGSLSQEGVARVRNAIFAKAFGDSPEGLNAVQRMAESTDNNIKRITTAFLQSAGKFAELKQAIKDGTRFQGLDITNDLSKAMEKFAALRDKGTSVDEYLAQQTMFGDDLSPFQKRLVQFLDANKASAKKINGVFDNYLTIANEAGNPNQTDLFGGKQEIKGDSLFQSAVETYEAGNRTTDNAKQTSLFDGNSGREERPQNSSDRQDVAQARESQATAGNDDTNTQRADAKRLVDEHPAEQNAEQNAEQSTEQTANEQQGQDTPQPGAIVTVNGRKGKLEKIVYGKARVKFPGESKAKLVNLSDLDTPDNEANYSLLRQTETPEFKTFFGDSKVTDEQGKPLVVYHGTHHDFEVFERSKGLSFSSNRRENIDQIGSWFTHQPENARLYGSKTLETYLKIEKPFTIHGDAGWQKLATLTERKGGNEQMREWLKQNGYDGIVLKDSLTDREKQDIYIALEPNQVKSATGNSGQFDPQDSSILKSVGGGQSVLGEAKIQRMLEGLRDKKQPTELLAQAAKFTPSSDGKMIFANPEAVEIIRRAITIAEGKEAPVFFGAYLKPSSMVEVGKALMKMRSDLPVGESRKAITELLRTIGDDKFAETGLPIIAASRDFTPVNSATIQEELAHQADFMTRGRIAAKHVLKSLAARRAARKVKETYGNISNETAAREVIAKSFRDDAHNELGISKDDAADIRNNYFEMLDKQNVPLDKLSDSFKDISATGDEFVKYYVRSHNQPTRNSGETITNGTDVVPTPLRNLPEVQRLETSRQGNRTNRLGSSREALDGRVSNESLRDDSESKVNPLVRIEAPERLRLERAFKGDAGMMRQAAEEVLMSRPPKSEPKTAIGKLVAKAIRGTTDLMTAPQSLITSFDLSAPLRQGDILTLSEPKLAAIAFVRQLNSLKQKGFDDFVDGLTQHPYISLAEHSDLYLSTLADSHSLGGREEAFMSRLLGDDTLFKNKIAEGLRKLATLHVRASERAYKTYLDSIRMDAFAKFSREVHEYNVRKGQPDSDEQYSAVASFINKTTGRGTLGRLEDAAPLLNSFFFSPRYWASRVQLLNPAFYAKLPAGVRGLALRKMLIFAGATAGIMALMKQAGAEITFDPNDADFLKAKLGNYHFDFGAGFIQNIRYASQMIELAKERLIDGKAPAFGKQNELDLTARFLRSKLSPAPGSLVNLYTGKDFAGQPATLKGELANSVTPMLVNDMAKAIQADGMTGAALMLPSVFGVGVSNYDKDAKKSGANNSANPKAKELHDDFVKRGRAGEDIKPQVLDKLKYGELTREQAKKVLKDAAIPEEKAKEESKLSHGNLQTDLEALSKMPADKQRELLPILVRRVKSKGTPVQREQMKEIIGNLPKQSLQKLVSEVTGTDSPALADYLRANGDAMGKTDAATIYVSPTLQKHLETGRQSVNVQDRRDKSELEAKLLDFLGW